MRFVGKSENGKKRSSDGSESRLLAKIKMAFTERSRLNIILKTPMILEVCRSVLVSWDSLARLSSLIDDSSELPLSKTVVLQSLPSETPRSLLCPNVFFDDGFIA